MFQNRRIAALAALAVTLFISACGGGSSSSGDDNNGGDTPTQPPQPPASPTSIVAEGPITGFGSIWVNGVKYDTSDASFDIDGSIGSQSDLSVGQVVFVQGTVAEDGTSGSAQSVSYNDLVEGPIQSITSASRMIVLGQTVAITPDTVFEVGIVPASLDGLSVGTTVEISGYRDAAGVIVATFIDREDTPDELEVTGYVQDLDLAALTFRIGGLSIDYSGAMMNDFDSGGIGDGQLVEAKGGLTLGAAGELIATEVERKDIASRFDGIDEAEIEGIITRFGSATDFDVSGIPVTTTSSTQYKFGTSAELALNVRVEVEGAFDSSGTLVAREVDFRLEGSVRIESTVEAVRSDGLTMLGIDIAVNSTTEFDDRSDLEVPGFGIDDINVGDPVSARGYEDSATGTVIATRIEREDAIDGISIRGFAEAVSEPEFSILGLRILTSGSTRFEDNDVLITGTEFFSRAAGSLVEARGRIEGDALIADEVEFEGFD